MTPINFNQILEAAPETQQAVFIDDSRRLKLHQSLWQKISHRKETNTLDHKLQEQILSFFEERYGFEDRVVFKRIWDKLASKIWTVDDQLTPAIIHKIDAKLRQDLIYHGKGIPQPTSQLSTDKTIQKLVQALLHGGDFSPFTIEERAAKAILIKHDKELMKQFQQELQREMDSLYASPPSNEQEEIVWRAFLGNIIALLPYSYPSTGDTFKIPILDKGQCRQVEYQADVVPLFYSVLSSPMTAIGLTSKTDPKAPPILSFIGTTFPAGSGFVATLLADFTPGHSVGEIVYERNKKKIDEWMSDKTDAHVIGMSLGGAMALHLFRNHYQKIDRVDIYSPPSLYTWDFAKSIGSTTSVNIYCQPGDIVSKLGRWPTGDNISLYTVFAHQKGVSEDPISSHVRAFTGCEKITVVKEHPELENQSFGRYLLTKMHQFLGPFVVFLPLVCTLFLYQVAHSVHQTSLYCFRKIRDTFKPK